MPLKFPSFLRRKSSRKKVNGASMQERSQHPNDDLNRNGQSGSSGVHDQANVGGNDTSRAREEVICKIEESPEKVNGASVQEVSQHRDDNLQRNRQSGCSGLHDKANGVANDTSRAREGPKVKNMGNNVIESSNAVEESISPEETDRRKSVMTDWRSCFIDLRNSMNEEDEEKLKFLCGSYLPSEEKGGSPLHIFRSIQSRSKDDLIAVQMIREIMFHIRRYDVLRNILCSRKEEYNGRKFSEFIVDPLRVLMVQIFDELDDAELSDLYVYFFKTDCRKPGDLQLFERLIQEKLVSRTNVAKLKVYMEEMGRRDIIRKLEKFSNDLDLQESSQPDDDEIKSPTQSHDLHYEEPSSFGDIAPESPAKRREPYLMREPTKRRGFCFIMNNKKFKYSLNGRKGSDRDVNCLKEIFEALNFDVITFTDLTRKKMLHYLESLASSISKHYDILVAFVMSHGKKDCIFSVDEKKVPIYDIKGAFAPSRCPTLEGKPKLFFIQACQGKKRSFARPNFSIPTSQPVMVSDSGRDNEDKVVESNEVGVDGSVPEEADFLIAKATVENYVSYRHVENGAWFIQSFCDVLKDFAKTKTINDIMLLVNYNVGERECGSVASNNLRQKQTPVCTFTLRSDCYLTYEAYETYQRSTRIPKFDSK